MKETDQQLVTWSASCGLPLHLLLTKADKLKKNAQRQALESVQSAIKAFPNVSVQLFSSLSRLGVADVKETLDAWFDGDVE